MGEETVIIDETQENGIIDVAVEDVEELDEIVETGLATVEQSNAEIVPYYNLDGKTIQEIFSLGTICNLKKRFNCIDCYDVEIDIFNDLIETSQEMQELLSEGTTTLPSFRYLCEDIFLSLYKYKVQLVERYELHKSVEMNHLLMQRCLSSEQYMKLRQTCTGDETYSLYGTIAIARDVLYEIKKKLKDLENHQEYVRQMKELMKKEQDIDELIDELDELIDDEEGGGGFIPGMSNGMNEEEIQALLSQMQNNIEDIDSIPHPNGLSISMEAMPNLNSLNDDLEDMEAICHAWGLESGTRVPFDIKLDAIETIRHSEKLKKMTDMIGKFKDSAIAEQKKKTSLGATDIKSVTQGNKIQDALPSEKMLLNNETTKKDFYNRYSENKLAVYDKENRDTKNKGPIIVCCDESGSMSGDREQWAKAITVGVLEVAQMQKRDFAYIRYESHAEKPIIIKKNEVAPDKVINICNEFMGGGTNFEAPLKAATEVIETAEFKNADILFISDGDCSVSDNFKRQFRELKERKDFCCKGILIQDYGYSYGDATTLNEFCDEVTYLKDLKEASRSDAELNKAIFGSL